MNVETITSRQNPLMTHLRKLASSRSYRKKSGEYLCDGTKLLDEALKWGAPVQTAVFSDGVEIPTLPDTVRAVCVSEDLMRSVSPMETPQGALFTVALPETKLPETLAGTISCWTVCRTPGTWGPSCARRTRLSATACS